MTESGKPYVAPDLTKRDLTYPRLNLHCAKCQDRVDGYVMGDGILNVWCHGDGLKIVLADHTEFDPEDYRGFEKPAFVLFGYIPAESPKPVQPLDLFDR